MWRGIFRQYYPSQSSGHIMLWEVVYFEAVLLIFTRISITVELLQLALWHFQTCPVWIPDTQTHRKHFPYFCQWVRHFCTQKQDVNTWVQVPKHRQSLNLQGAANASLSSVWSRSVHMSDTGMYDVCIQCMSASMSTQPFDSCYIRMYFHLFILSFSHSCFKLWDCFSFPLSIRPLAMWASTIWSF